jgi:hypothetical protein
VSAALLGAAGQSIHQRQILGCLRDLDRHRSASLSKIMLFMKYNGLAGVLTELFLETFGRISPLLSISLGVVKRTSNMLDLRDHLLPLQNAAFFCCLIHDVIR